ncbi:MAG TPA: ABC transporter permease [Chloroflexota bacterium]|jgi:peptide/nickel transport system permease protein
MTAFVVRRLLQSAVLLVVVTTASFFLVRLTPGGPEAALINNPRLGPGQVERLRQRFGLDDPVPTQYVRWVGSISHLDFGLSYTYARPATEVIGERLWPTLQLGLASYAIALLGIPLGAYAAMHHRGYGDLAVRVGTTVSHAMPSWWLGLSAIVLLNGLTGWFPNGPSSEGPVEWFKAIILPAVVLGLGATVSFSRFVRSEVLETLRQDYVRTAHAKGLPAPRVGSAHVLRNALMPVITLLGYLLPAVLSGALITEYVFGWPGIGRLFYEATTSRDYPILMALLTLTTVATIIGTLLADIGYGLVDPRIRYS